MLLQEHGRLAAWVGMVGLLAAATLRSASAQSALPGAGECGTCHYDLALAYTFPAGHAAALDCIACHGDPGLAASAGATARSPTARPATTTSTGIPPRQPSDWAADRPATVSTATTRTAARTSIWCATWCG